LELRLIPQFKLFLLFVALPVLGFSQKAVKTSAVPPWVKSVDYPEQVSDTLHSGGFYYLLLDNQYNIDRKESFHRTAIKVLTHKGIESIADIDVNYDPAYQRLTFHSLIVKRGNTTINKLHTSAFEIIQREENLERAMYDKSLDAIVNLDDIQVGDIVEYAYSLAGYNPVFENKFFRTLYFNYSSPIGKSFTHILCPSQRKLRFKKFNSSKDPNEVHEKRFTSYSWELNTIPALLSEDQTPSWFDPYDHVQISEYETWEDVIHWALPLYATEGVASADIDNKIAEIRKEHSTVTEQMNACIQFVQDDIRYLAFSGGVQGYKPHSPSLVFRQRFGDCKDKSLLLAFMLRKLGVESYTALVDTENGKKLHEALPSPGSFDHCIVTINLQDTTLWIDPTIMLERGTLKLKQTPFYYHALVLSEKEKFLRTVTVPKVNADRIVSNEDFFLQSVGGSAKLKVKSNFYGGEADYIRSYWKSSSLDEITKSYLEFYSNEYVDIQSDAEIEFHDNERANIITINEGYSIENLWTYDSADGKFSAEFYARNLATYLKKPASKKRTMPYQIGYPVEFTQVISVHLPERWTVTTATKKISSKGFEYTSSITQPNDTTAVLRYTYRSLQSFLDAKDVRHHLQQVDAALNDLSFTITYKKEDRISTNEQFNAPFFLIAIGAGGIVVLAMRKLNRYDPRSKNYEFSYSQIGGWMVLPFIGVFLSPLVSFAELFKNNFFEYFQWRILTDPSYPMYSPVLGTIVLSELIFDLFMLGFSILLIVQILQHRTSLPELISIFIGFNFVFLLAEQSCFFIFSFPDNYNVPDMSMSLLKTGLSTVIWVPYFLLSERVKGTFTNRLQ